MGWARRSLSSEAARSRGVLLEGIADTVIGATSPDHRAIMKISKSVRGVYLRGGYRRLRDSALDVALWDLKGKIVGGIGECDSSAAPGERVPVIASTHAFNPSLDFEIERHGAYVLCTTASRASRSAWASAARPDSVEFDGTCVRGGAREGIERDPFHYGSRPEPPREQSPTRSDGHKHSISRLTSIEEPLEP